MNPHFFVAVCSGAGGSSLGAVAARCQTLGIEIDSQIASLYQKNVGEVIVTDITKLNPYKVEVPSKRDRRRTGQLLIVQPSPECQKFSNANFSARKNFKAALSSASANMLYPTFEHYKIWQPDVVILENVPAYRHALVYLDFEKYMLALGYKCLPLLLNAADFGVPQSRKRFFSIFVEKDLPLPKIKKTHEQNFNGQICLESELSKLQWIGWYEALSSGGGIPGATVNLLETLCSSTLTNKQSDAIQKYIHYKYQLGNLLIDGQQKGANQQRQIREYNEPIWTIPASAHKGLPAALLVERVGGYGAKKVRCQHQPAWTIKAGLGTDGKGCDRSSFIDAVLSNADVRRLNAKALARLQTFPDSYQWSEKNSLSIRGIGNAIPPLLMQKLLEQIIETCA